MQKVEGGQLQSYVFAAVQRLKLSSRKIEIYTASDDEMPVAMDSTDDGKIIKVTFNQEFARQIETYQQSFSSSMPKLAECVVFMLLNEGVEGDNCCKKMSNIEIGVFGLLVVLGAVGTVFRDKIHEIPPLSGTMIVVAGLTIIAAALSYGLNMIDNVVAKADREVVDNYGASTAIRAQMIISPNTHNLSRQEAMRNHEYQSKSRILS